MSRGNCSDSAPRSTSFVVPAGGVHFHMACRAGHTKQPGPMRLRVGPELVRHLRPEDSDLLQPERLHKRLRHRSANLCYHNGIEQDTLFSVGNSKGICPGSHRPLHFPIATVAAVDHVPVPAGTGCYVVPPDPAAGVVDCLSRSSLDPNPEGVVAATRSDHATVDLVDFSLDGNRITGYAACGRRVAATVVTALYLDVLTAGSSTATPCVFDHLSRQFIHEGPTSSGWSGLFAIAASQTSLQPMSGEPSRFRPP